MSSRAAGEAQAVERIPAGQDALADGVPRRARPLERSAGRSA